MISVNNDHASLLASFRPLVMVELLTITLSNGIVLRYCCAPVALTYGGNTYQPLNWERGDITTNLGLEVDNVDITIWPKVYPLSCRTEGDQDLLMGMPWMLAARQNVLFNAEILLERGDIDPMIGPDIIGTLYQFSGRIAEPSYEDGFRFTIKSDLEILNRQVPAQIYQPGCPYTLYDSNCGLSSGDWVQASQVAVGSTKRIINCSLSQAAGYFDLGRIEFLTGDNAGTKRTIKTHTVGQFILAGNLFFTPGVGDSFIAWPGCDKRKATCNDKFSNTTMVNGVSVLRFGGQCFIPKPETAM